MKVGLAHTVLFPNSPIPLTITTHIMRPRGLPSMVEVLAKPAVAGFAPMALPALERPTVVLPAARVLPIPFNRATTRDCGEPCSCTEFLELL